MEEESKPWSANTVGKRRERVISCDLCDVVAELQRRSGNYVIPSRWV
jgi:hypothetical protein